MIISPIRGAILLKFLNLATLRRFFARGAYRQEGPTGQRGLLASGGGFSPGGLPLGYTPGRVPIPYMLNSLWLIELSVQVVCSCYWWLLMDAI